MNTVDTVGQITVINQKTKYQEVLTGPIHEITEKLRLKLENGFSWVSFYVNGQNVYTNVLGEAKLTRFVEISTLFNRL